MAIFHVQRQCWQRWPRVLIVERKGDNGGHEERRYVPEGKTEGQWKELCRKMTGLRDKSARESEEKAQLLMEAQDELLSKQAEIDGLRWGAEERDKLIRDMFHMLVGHAVDQYVGEEEWESVMSRVIELGIEL